MSIYPELISSTAQMIFALLIVLAGLLALFYFARRIVSARTGGSNSRVIRVAASAAVGFKKYVSLVEVAGEYLVLGISDHNICLLSKLEDPGIIEKLREQQKQKTAPAFAEHLQIFSSRLKELHNGK